MWKVISLFTLLVLAQAADINNILNADWWEVAFYPVSTYIPVCLRFRFAISAEETCTYADGRNATIVRVTRLTEKEEIVHHHDATPMLMVNTPAEVMPALNLGCKCGNKEVKYHAVARLVDDNYFIMYHHSPPTPGTISTDTNQIAAYLFAKSIVSEPKLIEVMTKIDDLKEREVAVKCALEHYNGPQ